MPSNKSYVTIPQPSKPIQNSRRCTVSNPYKPYSSDLSNEVIVIATSGVRVGTDLYNGLSVGPSGY